MTQGEPHHIDAKEVMEGLEVSLDGLNDEEVLKRRESYGRNELEKGKKTPLWLKFLRQFTDVLIIVLLVAAVITFVLEPHSIDWIVIAAIVVINAVIGFVQEEKAEDAIEKLKKMSSPKAAVIRKGKREEVDASDLVPGDIIHVESGMRVPADARLIEAHALKVNESALTGESMAAEKSARKLGKEVPLAERNNMVYMTTNVETGRGVAVITGTGMDSEIGKIAGMIQEVPRTDTPLQERLKKLGKFLGLLVLGICVLMFGLEIWREWDELSFEVAVELFETAVSLAVAAIPEGMPAVVTIALAVGLRVMAGKNVIVRKLPVVETLGSATVVCTDKTGTLTTGTMTADVVHVSGRTYRITGSGYEPRGKVLLDGKETEEFPEDMRHIFNASALCCDASLVNDNGWKILGDTTEGALIVMAEKAGFGFEEIREKDPREDEIPFDADRKMMSTLHDVEGVLVGYTKGAPESVLKICDREYSKDGVVVLNEGRRREVLRLTESMARQGYRTLGFAYSDEGRMEDRMVFLGVVGIRDKVRKEAKQAVATAKMAGIRPIMITGDHRLTAAAIGKEIGIIKRNDQSINCKDLDGMNDEEFSKTVKKVSVFARASPEHKVKIVKELKKKGEIVAMTGDGVNDAPSLKTADIGVAMGITGTDVSKEASDMIITDDNFASIVSAVEEGRSIYDNIRKVIQFLLSCNMGEVTVMLAALIVGWELPLVALQILWMNLVTDSFPALALVTEPKEKDLMKRKPRDPEESAITKDMIVSIAVSAGIITIGTLGVFWYYHDHLEESIELSRTMALTTMVFFQMWTAIAARSTTHTMAEIGWFSNKKLLGAIALAIALMIPIIYVPFLQNIFGTSALGWMEWSWIVVVSVSGLVVVEVWERINRRFFHYGVTA